MVRKIRHGWGSTGTQQTHILKFVFVALNACSGLFVFILNHAIVVYYVYVDLLFHLTAQPEGHGQMNPTDPTDRLSTQMVRWVVLGSDTWLGRTRRPRRSVKTSGERGCFREGPGRFQGFWSEHAAL